MGSASQSIASSSRASTSKEDAKMGPSQSNQNGELSAPFALGQDDEARHVSSSSSTPATAPAPPDETEATTMSVSGTSKDAAAGARGARTRTKHLTRSFKAYLGETVSHEEALVPMAWQSFLTGAIDALLYAKAGVWSGYQTGNVGAFSDSSELWDKEVGSTNSILLYDCRWCNVSVTDLRIDLPCF